MEERGTGKTTKQMKEAPERSIYVWPNQDRGYAKGLAQTLGRGDLHIKSMYEISRGTHALRGINSVVLDHAVMNARDIKTIGKESMSNIFHNRFKPPGMAQISGNMYINTDVNSLNDAHIMCPWDSDIMLNMTQLTKLRDEINKLIMQQTLLGETLR